MLRGLIPYFAYAYVQFVGLTSKITIHGEEHRRELRRDKRRFIYAFWHQRAPFFAYTHSHENASILVSQSKDGEIIAQLLRLSGVGATRGSSSRGGQAATRAMMETIESGQDLGFTMDGPKGPARKAKPAIMHLAQKLGLPVLPLTLAFSRKFEFLKAWDRFHLPLPFGRISVRYGAPIIIGPGDDTEAAAATLSVALDTVTEQADREV